METTPNRTPSADTGQTLLSIVQKRREFKPRISLYSATDFVQKKPRRRSTEGKRLEYMENLPNANPLYSCWFKRHLLDF
jgi:hypothetical protein